MSNPFAGWTQAMLDAHNERVAKQSVKEVRKTGPRHQLPVQRVHAAIHGAAVITGGAISEKNTRIVVIHTQPVPAPRMTRQDKWRGRVAHGKTLARRPIVQAYFDYRALLQEAVGDVPTVPDEVNAVFHFAMPVSWSKKRRQELNGQPHRQRPDGDNCTKAVQDALFLEDGGVWRGAFEKRWAIHGRVVLKMIWR